MTEKQLSIFRHVWFVIGVAMMLVIRWWSHAVFDIIMTLSVSGMIANNVCDDMRKKFVLGNQG